MLSDSFAETVHKRFVSHIQNNLRILGNPDRFLTSEDIFGKRRNKKE